FFQAEDGIRDLIVTGVQTCALPICRFVTRATASIMSGLRAARGLGTAAVTTLTATAVSATARTRVCCTSFCGVPGSIRQLTVAEIGRASCRERGWDVGVTEIVKIDE